MRWRRLRRRSMFDSQRHDRACPGTATRIGPSASPIRRVAPGRDQERHVEMAFGLADRKPQRNLVEKWRIRHRHLPLGKILADTEHQFVAADRHRPAIDQRLIGSAVRVGDRRASRRGSRRGPTARPVRPRSRPPACRCGYRARGSTGARAPAAGRPTSRADRGATPRSGRFHRSMSAFRSRHRSANGARNRAGSNPWCGGERRRYREIRTWRGRRC